MCVIIYIPVGQQISKSELQDAWIVNSDGAGFAVIINKQIHYEKGFMNFSDYYQAIKKYIGGFPLVLHFRISTSNVINEVQTHPFELHNKTGLIGNTHNPLICMNGVISGQVEYKGMNDTMSYIQDHAQAFQIIADNNSEDLLNIIADSTGCKWCIITPDTVLISDNFTEYKGRYYSNKNHLNTYKTVYSSTRCYFRPSAKDLLIPKVYQEVKNDKKLYQRLLSYIQRAPLNELNYLFWLDSKEELEDVLTFTLY